MYHILETLGYQSFSTNFGVKKNKQKKVLFSTFIFSQLLVVTPYPCPHIPCLTDETVCSDGQLCFREDKQVGSQPQPQLQGSSSIHRNLYWCFYSLWFWHGQKSRAIPANKHNQGSVRRLLGKMYLLLKRATKRRQRPCSPSFVQGCGSERKGQARAQS